MSKADLSRFPRPSLAVDVAVLSVVDGRLAMVLWRRNGRTHHDAWALPGSFVRERERLTEAVGRTLREKCGIEGLFPTQLAVMDDPARDDRGWVMSVAHLDVVRPEVLESRHPDSEVILAPIRTDQTQDPMRDPSARTSRSRARQSILELPGGQKALPFDHETIARLAVEKLRGRYAQQPDPAGLIDDGFTILQLRRLHEAIEGSILQKDTFRRAMLPHVEPLEATEEGVVGRPARLFRRLAGS
ncbi:MAG TPA: NUDIX domain-containing protein [Microthrixaceae bacterium]|nr:NUDIX domain-containing protein [Microthrixaceae bacterium]